MNSNGIIPPREGVENLAAARKALTGKDVSSSHITDSIIKTHSALEALFRQYLSEMNFVPGETRNRANEHFETSFPELVRAISAYGKPSLKDRESEILQLNQIRNQHAHGLATSTTTQRDAIFYVELAEEIYGKYSKLDLQKINRDSAVATHDPERKGLTMETDDPKLVRFEKWGTRFSDILGIKATEKDRVVWFKGDTIIEIQNVGTRRIPSHIKCDRYALVHLGEKPWTFSLGVIECKDYWVVTGELSIQVAVKSDADVGQLALNYDAEIKRLKTRISQELRTRLASESPGTLENRQGQIALLLEKGENGLAEFSTPFHVRNLVLNLKAPEYQEKAINRKIIEAGREEEMARLEFDLNKRRKAAEAADAEWKRKFEQDTNTKLRDLNVTEKEFSSVVKPTMEAIAGKEKAFLAYQASKSPENLQVCVASIFGNEIRDEEFQRIAKIVEMMTNRPPPPGSNININNC